MKGEGEYRIERLMRLCTAGFEAILVSFDEGLCFPSSPPYPSTKVDLCAGTDGGGVDSVRLLL